jgi:class 3 adenylate cyclase/YHS domain-containing protein
MTARDTPLSPGEPADAPQREHSFLFADLAGYTALTEAHGDEQAAELSEAFTRVVRRLLPADRADVVKTIGDAVMIRIDGAAEAIRLGLSIVAEVEQQPDFPTARVGMHTGPAVQRSGDWFGATVNVAARVAGAAGGGEVVLTDTTRESATSLDDVDLERHGEARFRNVGEPVLLFRAVRVGDTRGRLVIDPVCRMVISPGQAAGRLVHGGIAYRFCSLACVTAFAQAPERYTAR